MTRLRRTMRVLVYGLAAFVFLLIVATVVERVAWRGRVLPGVQLVGASVAGEPGGNVTDEVAQAASRLEHQSFEVRAGSKTLTFDPGRIDLRVDTPETSESVTDAGRSGNPVGQVLGTVLRIARPDEIRWQIHYDKPSFETVMSEWERIVALGATDGTLRFEGSRVIAVAPKQGRILERPAADQVLLEALETGARGGVVLPTRTLHPKISRAEVQRAASRARQLLARPVTVTVQNVSTTLSPEALGSMLRPQPKGSTLDLTIDHEVLHDRLGPDLQALEGPPADARFEVHGSKVDVVPHTVGTQLDLDQIAGAILDGQATVHGELYEKKPDVTTDDLEALNIKERVSTFTTYHAAGQPRVKNIHRAADIVDGTIVKPGTVFSLNGTLGKRTTDRGFVVAPVIYGGEFTEDVGGGISQFATTTFNAAFFGGYPFVEYQAHSYYISRYPKGREATVSWPKPDLRFKNDTDNAILIKTGYTSSSITVSFYSTKIRTVEATPPDVVQTIPAPVEYQNDPGVERGQQKVQQKGHDGQVVKVTRIIRDLDGKELGRRTFTTHYRPEQRVVAVNPCDNPDPAKRPPDDQCQLPPPSTGPTSSTATTTTVAGAGPP